MAQRRLVPSLTHQRHVIAEELETDDEDCSFQQIHHSTNRRRVSRQDSVTSPVVEGANAKIGSAMLSKQTVGRGHNMESSEPLLLDSADSVYSNGAIQLSTFIGESHDIIDGFDRPITTDTDTSVNCSAGNVTKSLTSSPTLTLSAEVSESEGSTPLASSLPNHSDSSSSAANTSGSFGQKRTPADIIRNRQRFAIRSISTDNPVIKKEKNLTSNRVPALNRLGSVSGPLLRVNSFEKSTQTLPTAADKSKNNTPTLSDRLSVEHKTSSRNDTTSLSNLGVEYMKGSGAYAVTFKQLQKPPPVRRRDTVSDFSRHSNYDSRGRADSKTSVIGAEVRTVVLMSGEVAGNNQPSHVIKVDAEDDQATSTSHTGYKIGQGKSLVETDPPPIPQHHHIGYRLGQRKALAERRRKIADICCAFALLGLALMIIETECNISKRKPYTKEDAPSYVIKGLITFSTIVLLALIGLYHAVEVKLFVVDNCIEDWRIAMSWQRVIQIGAELIICSIHPLPIPYTFQWTIIDIKTGEIRSAEVPTDIIFSLPMFARLYLIVRVMLLHSKLFTDASSRSIGALNKITFNTRFVLKTLMTIFPGTVMGVVMLSLWIICAWTFRACESYHDPLFANFLNTLYMVAITFLSVGYGDFVPHTYCGRAISVISGLMGAGCTALVVAVIARKLELTRAEKHVHNFMLETQLNKKLKDAAANVLRETWLIYKYTKLLKRVNGRKVRAHQRKFLHAIQTLRLVKLKQRKLADQANSLTDFAKTTAQVHDIVADLRGSQESSSNRIEKIEQVLQDLQVQIDALPLAVARILAEKQASTSSFISANDVSAHNSPIGRRHTSLAVGHQAALTSAQSSFDSCG